ncbi:MAG TPA: electron transport complex subunit RsxG [Novimethylophilus sp.]|jgi:electron transport complex protein RnfG|uniref:electron transport complex subunit RsxG n=1 Tax=Novimethylophilus sp. TaxID=2137426 RepID=UPI002F42674E
MSASIFKHTFSTAGVMIGFTIIGTALLAYTYATTREPIAKSEAEARMALFRQILPEALHDNDLLKDVKKIPAGGDLGNRDETEAHRARLGGQPSAVILEATAPDGYSGDIKLLIAVRADGEIVGVRVLAHKETPGLGDYIDIGHSDWIKKNFDGQSLAKTPDDGWKVKKDNGRFDYMVGATVTPRAVVKAVHKTLQYFAAHRDELFAAAASKGNAK